MRSLIRTRRYILKWFQSITKKPARMAGFVLFFVLLLSGCAQAAYPQQPGAVSVPVTGGTTVQAADNPKLGKILVNASGMTLYTFAIDTPTESKCASDCATYWPPVTTGAQPSAGSGLAGKVSTISRPDGTKQVTYQGKPLYTYILDKKPGDTVGDGIDDFGGVWHVVSLNGSSSSSINGGNGSSGPHY